jgi:hypothetical protein
MPRKKSATEPATPVVTPYNWTDGGDRVLILKQVNEDGTAHGGFRWPESGPVEAPDWDPAPVCGGGLHGWAWGVGIGDGASLEVVSQRKCIVFAATPADVIGPVENRLKCKARGGEVLFCGSFVGAWGMIALGRQRLLHAMAQVQPTTGRDAHAATTGDDAMACALGVHGRVKVGDRGAFALATWSREEGYRFLTGKVGENGIKPNTWYAVKGGAIAEVPDV